MDNKITNLIYRLEEANKKLLAEHQKTKEKIYDFIQERSKTLQEKKEEIKFLAQIVHSIGNSLTILRLNLELLKDKINKKEYDIFLQEITLIDSTLRKLIEISEISSSSNFSAKSFDLSKALKNLISKKNTDSYVLETNIEDNVFMLGIQKEIKLMLENLIENALKYTEKHKKISIFLEKRVNNVIIKIADEGCGIPEKDISKIFQEFVRASNQKDNKKGSGLGLSLVKRIIKKHHGFIEAKSKLEKGTTFIIILPLECDV